MVDDDFLFSTIDLSDSVDWLGRGADSMFLRARLMVNCLHSPALTPAARLQAMFDVVLPE